MALGNIQRNEIMKFIFHLRPRHHGEAGLRKDLFNPQARTRDGMNAAPLLAAARQADIDRALGKLRGYGRLFKSNAMHLQGCVDSCLGIVDSLARGRPFLCR